jgi:SAM-dependent methyltransferase
MQFVAREALKDPGIPPRPPTNEVWKTQVFQTFPRLLGALALLAAGAAAAQLESLNEAPVVPGKDVVWVPTPDRVVERMLALADVRPHDVVYDLGSGDGKIPIAAARRFGARGVGIEYSPDLVETSRAAARREGVADRVRFIEADLFLADFRPATVVTLFLLTELNLRLRPRILDMKPGTRVVSHMFRMGDWTPDEHVKLGSSDLYLWHVPARVAGTWSVVREGAPFELVIEQRYQRVWGTARVGGESIPLRNVVLKGDSIGFEVFGAQPPFAGRVEGHRMFGEAGRWSATRTR